MGNRDTLNKLEGFVSNRSIPENMWLENRTLPGGQSALTVYARTDPFFTRKSEDQTKFVKQEVSSCAWMTRATHVENCFVRKLQYFLSLHRVYLSITRTKQINLLLFNNFCLVIQRRIIVYGLITRYGPQSVARASGCLLSVLASGNFAKLLFRTNESKIFPAPFVPPRRKFSTPVI